MKSTIDMYGINIELGEVPDKPKRKYRKRGDKAKSPRRPERDKMMRSPNDGGNTITK